MSGAVAHRKRLINVTEGNCRNNHFYISGHYDFFPKDCIGRSSKSRGVAKGIYIHLEGLQSIVETDIGVDPRNGKPRRFFRGRKWVKEFFNKHNISPGDVIALERLSKREYRLYPFETQSDSSDDWHKFIGSEPDGNGPTVIELFAGCGGMALGFKMAGFRTVLCNEWDPAACESLYRNVTERVAQCAIQEIRELPYVDVVAGGPPCQGFSNLGEKIPNDPRNQLWRQYVRIVREVKPKIFVLENVAPLLKSAEYRELVRILTRIGYKIDGQILNSADFGVPQTRKRAIVIGVLDGKPSFPEPTHYDPKKSSLVTSNLRKWRTVRDTISDLESLPTEENWHIGRNPTSKSIQRYKCIPAGGNRFDLPSELTPDCWKRKTKGGTDLFGRLWWDRPSVTIRCEFYKPEKGRYLHPQAHRPITHREAARLQGFPDEFNFQGKRIEVGIQIGNAMPPPFASAIASHLIKTLSDRSSIISGRRSR